MHSEDFGEHGDVHMACYASFRRLTGIWELDILGWALGIVCQGLFDLRDV